MKLNLTLTYNQKTMIGLFIIAILVSALIGFLAIDSYITNQKIEQLKKLPSAINKPDYSVENQKLKALLESK